MFTSSMKIFLFKATFDISKSNPNKVLLIETMFKAVADRAKIQHKPLRKKLCKISLPQSELHSSEKSKQSILPSHFSDTIIRCSFESHMREFVQFSSSEPSPHSSIRLHTCFILMQYPLSQRKYSFLNPPLDLVTNVR